MEEEEGTDDHNNTYQIGEQSKRQGGYDESCDQYTDHTGDYHLDSNTSLVLPFSDKGNAAGRAEKCTGSHHDWEGYVCTHPK